jgi:cell wall-associated NlpC family hydrolase
VTALRAFVFPGPDIKLPPLAALSLNCALSVSGEREGFLELETGGMVHARHAAEWHQTADDFVAVATRFLGVPYLWGGRTAQGIDCSGLVQIALEATGSPAPRDSDVQAAQLGEPLGSKFDASKSIRGDLVFWQGHVGIMADAGMLLHASAHHMATVIEPVDDALARISQWGAEVNSVRRL